MSLALNGSSLSRWTRPCLLLGLFVLLGVGLVGCKRRPTPKEDAPDSAVSDIQLIPANAQAFVTIRIGDLWAKPEIKAAIDAARKKNDKMEAPAARLERDTGLKPSDVERFHIVGIDDKSKLAWGVAKTTKDLDQDRILSHLKDRAEKRHADRRYYVGKSEEGQEVAVHFGGPRVLVMANNEASMQRCLDLVAKPVQTGPLASLIKQADEGKADIVAGVNPKGGSTDAQKGPAGMMQGADAIQVVAITATVGKDVDLDIRATTTDEAAAQKVQTMMRELQKKLEGVGGEFGLKLLLMGYGVDMATANQISKLLAAMKPEVKGNEVSVKVKTDTAGVVTALLTAINKQMKKKE